MKSIFSALTIILLTLSMAGCTKKEPTQAPAEETPAAAPEPAKDMTDTPATVEAMPEEPAPTPAEAPAAEPASPAAEEPVVHKAASLDGLTYIKGKPVTFEKGKVTVVEFWATWCPPCKESIPHLTKVQKQYKDKGVTVIGISNEQELETVKTFVDRTGRKDELYGRVGPTT